MFLGVQEASYLKIAENAKMCPTLKRNLEKKIRQRLDRGRSRALSPLLGLLPSLILYILFLYIVSRI